MRFASQRPRLDSILPKVEKPGRYVGLERNVVRKDLSASAVTVALAFPDTYEIGMSHTGLKILYEIVNRRPEFACERTYAPWTDLEGRMREEGIPLFTIESLAPVADFDVVGFSLQSELNYSNVPNMLDLAGIPVWQRDVGDHHIRRALATASERVGRAARFHDAKAPAFEELRVPSAGVAVVINQ